MAKIFLNPEDNESLKDVYTKVFQEADEIYLATAFLTEWSFSKVKLGSCKQFVAIIGTHFGLTKKQACRDLMKWLPESLRSHIYAFPFEQQSTFHPKVLVWKKDEKFFSLIGSSNLTSAALNKNYEINVKNEIEAKDYERIVEWFKDRSDESQVMSQSWIDSYEESKVVYKSKNGKKEPNEKVFDVRLPQNSESRKWLEGRRKQMKVFKRYKAKLFDLMKENAAGRLSNKKFWEDFCEIWHARFDEENQFRFQNNGVERSCSKANWHEATNAFMFIYKKSEKCSVFELDKIVAEQIDRLKRKKNPARKAWLSEMLCQFFPNTYPLLDDPVNQWVKNIGWKLDRGGSEGKKYIDLATRLRSVVKENKPFVNNLAELDILMQL
ncbi:phospholipase D family protein [Fibrobacter sp.]|uniref:phospholipase D family protein n=1 Tax=Fibrobacter sp. TaxID=35828 RepID=UPI0025C497AF|nr:phospholipase D family protein [Fibrobacter sp.]MBR3071373.1 phospholipase D family protein [Fibrobacter sp.]